MESTFLSPFNYFNNPNNSSPVGLGKLYIGLPDTDPTIEANQVQVYIVPSCACPGDENLPVSQPLQLTAGGVVSYNGTPVQVIVDVDEYSVKVTTSNGAHVYYSPRVKTIASEVIAVVSSALSPLSGIKALKQVAGAVQTSLGYNTNSGVGGGQYVWNPDRSWLDHNGGTVLSSQAMAVYDGTTATLAAFLNFTPTAGSGCWELILIAGTSKLEITPYNFGAAANNIFDDSLPAQKAADTGIPRLVFPDPVVAWRCGDVQLKTRGQQVVGSGFRKCGIVPLGFACFHVRESGIEISRFWFRPETVTTGEQDTSNTSHLVYINNIAGENVGVDGFEFFRNYCQDIAGAAILMKSPLRESYIYRNQFRGMGNKANQTGVIHTNLNAAFNDSSNFVYIQNNVFYRGESPFISCNAVAGSNPAKRYHDNWNISKNLFHGQLLSESEAVADPTGPVVGGETDMLLLKSIDYFNIDDNTFASFHGDYSAVKVTALSSDDKNGQVVVTNNRVLVDNNGSYTGVAVSLADCFNTAVVGNSFKPGFQSEDIEIVNTGTFAYTPVITVGPNSSINQFDPEVSLPALYKVCEPMLENPVLKSTTTDDLIVKDTIRYQRSGRTTLTASATTASVTFAALGLENMPNGNYDVYTRVIDQNLNSWASAANSSGFTLNLETNPGTRTISWFVVDSTGF